MTKKLAVLDLFSGIGGFSLGLERTNGFETKAFCEINKFCQRVLAKHWPKVPIYDDIKELTGARLAADGIAVDVICGGFPCQDISFAGERAGLDGARSGLWREYARLIGEVRPQFVVVENVPGLLSLGMADVLGDLSALGFNAAWDCVPASAIGAPHQRDRVWIVAHANGERRGQAGCHAAGGTSADSGWAGDRPGDAGKTMADAGGSRLAPSERQDLRGARRWFQGRATSECSWWSVEPDVGRVAHGVPSRVDRLRSLGNAVVPQIPEIIGKAILEAEGGQ